MCGCRTFIFGLVLTLRRQRAAQQVVRRGGSRPRRALFAATWRLCGVPAGCVALVGAAVVWRRSLGIKVVPAGPSTQARVQETV